MNKKYNGDISHNKHQKLYHYCHNYSLIENYEKAKADNFDGWVVHHKFETKCPAYKPTSKELKDYGLYYNRPADELIFMRTFDHEMLHNPIGKKGHPQTKKQEIREWHLKNHGRFYRCIETGEVKCEKDWLRAGYYHVRDVATGKRNHSKNYHFEFVNNCKEE